MFAPKIIVVSFVALLVYSATATNQGSVDFNNPVRTAQEDEVKQLPGLNHELNFKHYSGYLEADDLKPTNRFWHYWFVESQSKDAARDPLVLWLTGGPGCSSLVGLLTELGPFRISENLTISSNPFSWNKKANIIFLESPAGVGYSYAVNGDIKADDDTTAKQNYVALKSFLRKFPQYKKSPLYLTGESYGGVYLPTLGVLVDRDPDMNLKGVAIGNGYLDANKLAESLVYFTYYHGLIGSTTWKGLADTCCHGRPPARGQCQFTDPNRSKECSSFVYQATEQIESSGLNPYDVYDQCPWLNSAEAQKRPSNLMANPKRKGREHFDRKLMLAAFNITTGNTRTFSGLQRGRSPSSVREQPTCTDDFVLPRYLNQPDVRQALHIPDALKTDFASCFEWIEYTMIYPGAKDGLAPQMRQLINSSRGLTLLVYNGDVDLVCNFLGDEWFVDDLNRKIVRDYKPWLANKQVAGFVKHFDGITFMTVKGSGHMVPIYRPAEALQMFQWFLGGLKPSD